MADEVPVSEILTNSLDYLITLGNALHERGKDLIDSNKNLAREQSLQKSAKKIIKICQLSRKCMNEVETRMRTVFNAVQPSPSTSTEILPESNPSTHKLSVLPSETSPVNTGDIPQKRSVLIDPASADGQNMKALRINDDQRPSLCKAKIHTEIKQQNSKEPSDMETNSKTSKMYENNKSDKELSLHSDKTLQNIPCEKEKEDKSIRDTCGASSTLKRSTGIDEDILNAITDSVKEIIDNCKDIKLEDVTVMSTDEQNITDFEDIGCRNSKTLDQDKDAEPEKEPITCAKKKLVCSSEDEETSLKKPQTNLGDSVDIAFLDDPNKISDAKKLLVWSSDDNENTELAQPIKPVQTLAKPIIKCVNINALLKPDLVKKLSSSDKLDLVKNKTSLDKPNIVKNISSVDKLASIKKKTSADAIKFKPKQFDIVLERLPLSSPYLKKYNLQNSKNKLLKPDSSSDSDSDVGILMRKKNKNVKSVNGSKTQSKEKKKRRRKRAISSSSSQSDGDVKMGRSKAKPGNSSSRSSDSNEPDRDGECLANMNSLDQSRQTDSDKKTSGINTAEDTSSSKGGPPSDQELAALENISSGVCSEGASASESDGADIPTIAREKLNGNEKEIMLKNDLLDSSASHTESDVDAKKNKVVTKKSAINKGVEKKAETDDESSVSAKRRKVANAISSDSEGGSSRQKRMSDFEDSEDDSSVPMKRKKKKAPDSDSSADSHSESKKQRRRIKELDDSDMSGSESETEGRNKHGRKNIRKVMGKNQLEEATKKAAREEKERLARIAGRQKLYNNVDFDESSKGDEVVLEKVVLDFDPETKEPLIEVDRGLVKKLKPHQANGIKFMWDACFESVKRIKKDRGSGCILAHCMGLGKTLQVVTLTHTLLTHGPLTSVRRVLVVCPLSTVLNWVSEFRMWLKHANNDLGVDVYELSRFKQNSERAFQLQNWYNDGGVCVLGYEMFRNLSADNPKKFKKKLLRTFQESLVDPGPDLVVCDEGHLLKNEKTSLSQSMNRVRTLRRIVLTGTPLQNNLKEYYCMVQFVKPNLLGKYNEYLNRFVNPITNGQYTDSTEHDIKIMKRRSHVLHKMLDGAVQRRDYSVLAPFLPPKHEYVLFITLTDVQVKLYQHYLDNYSRRPLPGKSSGFLFPDFQSLQRIWTHPLVLKYNSERYEIMQQKKREREEEDSEGSLVDFIDYTSTSEDSTSEESSDDMSDMSDDSRKKSKKKKAAKKGKGKDSKASTRRGTRANPDLDVEDQPQEAIEVKYENPTEWWVKLVSDEELDDIRNSHKLILLFDILRQCEVIGDKLLVFSQSLYSLDLIEHFLGKVDEATQEGRMDEKLGNHMGSWSPGVDYFRLDGSTSCENRSIWCKNFNREDNPRARLFLISTRAGGLGINLVAANRVVIFDVSWNPSHDVQSIFRVYRFGQKKPCYIYRFLAMGTMEEKIYERQVTKQAISKRVIDEQQIDRHYAENDLAELYKFEPAPPTPRPVPSLPKDLFFAEMLQEHKTGIYKYHEHDSLLENKEEETLSEEERKAAWEDFENEKTRPPPTPFVSPWAMTNGMMPGLLQQQQQSYAAIMSMLRKEMPTINDNQLNAMLPLIFNSNPGLMQKIYGQAGMMNSVMMNPAANHVGGAGDVGSASSSLQYSPPWQRQHQQQQQIRLQQLMQHQNMGAKYYAGGLGSRDPIAMAMQQQQARQLLVGGGGSRPRGRPPLVARDSPPPTTSDVVNLDSD